MSGRRSGRGGGRGPNPQAKRRLRGRRARRGAFAPTMSKGFESLTFNPPVSMHNPLPQIYYTKFTASGSFYTASGAGTGDYNWSFKLNSINTPFSAVTSGVTWNGITPSTYQMPGVTSLFSPTMYTFFIVTNAQFEMDVTPQSVIDTVVTTLTPSIQAGFPASIATAMARPFTTTQRFASGRTYRQRDYPFKQRFSAWKLVGFSKGVYENDTSGNFVGVYSSSLSDPPTNFPWVLNIETGDNSTLNVALEVSVRITYWVKCYGLRNSELTEQEDMELVQPMVEHDGKQIPLFGRNRYRPQ